MRIDSEDVALAVLRIAGNLEVYYSEIPQDHHLARKQEKEIRCGDNGIFKCMPVTDEQRKLTAIARHIYDEYEYDGKYIIDKDRLVICQSNAWNEDLRNEYPTAEINPLGPWTGGTDVDSGAVIRKLDSEMGHSITGRGLHGKDLSKADVSVNIYAFLKAQETGKPIQLCYAIKNTQIDKIPYTQIVETARKYVDCLGGFVVC